MTALLLAHVPATASPPGPAASPPIAELTRAGAAAAKAGRWEACITAYAAAAAIEDTPRTSGELGLCEERASQFIDAYRHLRRALEGAPSPPAQEPWKGYQAAIARVLARVVVVYVTVQPRGARVVLDGRPMGLGDGRSVAVEPGAHTFAARLDGHEDAIESLTVRVGDVANVDLRLKPRPSPPAEAAPGALPGALPGAPSTAAVPARTVAPGPTVPGRVPAPFRWCLPAATPSGVLGPLACVGFATAITSAAISIGLEADRQSVRSKLVAGECAPNAASKPEACATLAQRIEQRDAAVAVTIGAHVATGVLAGAALIAAGYERGATSPTIVPTASLNEGGIVILGTW